MSGGPTSIPITGIVFATVIIALAVAVAFAAGVKVMVTLTVLKLTNAVIAVAQ